MDLDALSHELRTPLTPVMAALQVLSEDTDLPSRLLPYIEIIKRCMEGQARLIDDLLDLSQIMRGQLPLAPVPTDVNQLVEGLVAEVRSQADDKRLAFDVALSAKRPLVRADPLRSKQALANVVHNAIKFTPEGGRITIETRDDDGVVVVEVHDTGVGIGSDELANVFDAFTRQTHKRPHLGGVGFGLALSHAIVRLHGGTIEVSSEGRGTGTQVRVQLPAMNESAKLASPKESAGPHSASILLVDDHDDTLMLMKMMLERRGYAVTAATTAGEALAAARAHSFDLLISDINLPDKSGLELIREVNQLGTSRGIALSGFGRDADVRRSREAGFVEHLVKPVNLQKLHEVIQKVLT